MDDGARRGQVFDLWHYNIWVFVLPGGWLLSFVWIVAIQCTRKFDYLVGYKAVDDHIVISFYSDTVVGLNYAMDLVVFPDYRPRLCVCIFFAHHLQLYVYVSFNCFTLFMFL